MTLDNTDIKPQDSLLSHLSILGLKEIRLSKRKRAAIHRELAEGRPLSDVLTRHKGSVTKSYLAVIRAGEKSNNLDKTVHELSSSLKTISNYQRRLYHAISYHVVIALFCSSLLILTSIYLYPIYKAWYHMAGLSLSSIGGLIGIWVYLMEILGNTIKINTILVILISFFAFIFINPGLRTRIIYNIPFIGKVLKDMISFKIIWLLHTMLTYGISLSDAIDSISELTRNRYIRQSLNKIAFNMTQSGESLSQAASSTGIFSPFAIWLVKVGEEKNCLLENLGAIVDFYKNGIEVEIMNFVTSFETISLSITGLIVGGMVYLLFSSYLGLLISFY
ncbi:MAG: type II secretion system F family protein [bacterium]